MLDAVNHFEIVHEPGMNNEGDSGKTRYSMEVVHDERHNYPRSPQISTRMVNLPSIVKE